MIGIASFVNEKKTSSPVGYELVEQPLIDLVEGRNLSSGRDLRTIRVCHKSRSECADRAIVRDPRSTLDI
jgi:hypothetical protein